MGWWADVDRWIALAELACHLLHQQTAAYDSAEPPPLLQVEEALEQFIAAVEGLFDKHKAAAGHAETKLTVY